MANVPIPSLPVAVTIDGTEQVEIVQPAGSLGTSKRTTTQDIANLAGVNPGIPADRIAYTAPFSGSEERTAESRLSDIVSVKDFGAVGNGIVDDTDAFDAALLTGCDILLPAGTYLLTPITVSIDNTRLIGAPDVTLRFPVVGATTAAIVVAADGFAITGTPVIQGPAAGVYVADENCIQMVGTSSASRRSGLYVDAEIKNFGFAGVYAKWVDNVRIAGTSYFHDCGYAGGMFLSCRDGVVADGARVGDITPGTSSNAYGFTLTQNSVGYASDPNAGTPLALNPFCQDWHIGAVLAENILWVAIDAHGAYNVRVDGASTYNCKQGVHIAGGSGGAVDYGGWSNSVVNCVIDARNRDGTAGDYENTGIGINATVSGTPAATLNERVEIRGNTLYGYGVPDTDGGPAIGAEQCGAAIIADNIMEAWGGVGVQISNSPGAIVSGNIFRQLADPSDTQAMAIKQTASAALYQTITENRLDANGGTAAIYGFYTRSTVRPMVSGNDFRAATTAPLNLTASNFTLGGDVVPYKAIDLGGGGGSTTIDLAEFAYGCTGILLQLTAAAPITITNMTNAPTALVVTLRVANGSSNITFNRANAALAGSADFVGGAYDTLVLQQHATSGVVWVELTRALNG